MSKASILVLTSTLLMVGGCSKQSQLQPSPVGSKPSAAQPSTSGPAPVATVEQKQIPAVAPVDAFGPFVGKWIGYGCNANGDSDISFRVEFFGTEDAPTARFREFGILGRSRLEMHNMNGKRGDNGTFVFHRIGEEGMPTWSFKSTKPSQLTGALRGASGSLSAVFLELDAGQKLVEYLKEKEHICKTIY